ncbi:hypothetical protein RJT34_30231 [Clitoria ternatea]|uniref:Uncharacterized protein n=1 Tax=Clitoria ternatea TaxID=43366 RepID=A0AAN9ESP7_CLITE
MFKKEEKRRVIVRRLVLRVAARQCLNPEFLLQGRSFTRCVLLSGAKKLPFFLTLTHFHSLLFTNLFTFLVPFLPFMTHFLHHNKKQQHCHIQHFTVNNPPIALVFELLPLDPVIC